MSHTLTLKYNTNTNRVQQTYWGENPEWSTEQGTTITTTEADHNIRQKKYQEALSTVSESDYDPETESPIPYLTYDPETDSFGGGVEIEKLPESLQ